MNITFLALYAAPLQYFPVVFLFMYIHTSNVASCGCRYHVDLEGFESMLAGVLLLVLDAALTAVLMATGPEIARLETGRTSVIAVGKEAI